MCEVDCTGVGSGPAAGFDISGVESLRHLYFILISKNFQCINNALATPGS
jgi:hypothetical protein